MMLLWMYEKRNVAKVVCCNGLDLMDYYTKTQLHSLI